MEDRRWFYLILLFLSSIVLSGSVSAIRCVRCASYLGDAHLQGETCERNCNIHAPSSTTTGSSVTSDNMNENNINNRNSSMAAQQNFDVNELRDVRFSLQAVSISTTIPNSITIQISAEQVILS